MDLCQITQGNLFVSGYFTKIKRLWDEYAMLIKIPPHTCGSSKEFANLLQNQGLMQFLMDLNDAYKTLRENILMISPLPSVPQAYQLILQDEKQRDVSNPSFIQNNSAALYTNDDKGMKTQVRGSSGGQAMDKKSQMFCRYYEKQGHLIGKCYRLHGFPPGTENNQGKRMAADVQSEMDESMHPYEDNKESEFGLGDQDKDGGVRGTPSMSREQFGQLMTLLGRLRTRENQGGSGLGSGSGQSMLAVWLPTLNVCSPRDRDTSFLIATRRDQQLPPAGSYKT